MDFRAGKDAMYHPSRSSDKLSKFIPAVTHRLNSSSGRTHARTHACKCTTDLQGRPAEKTRLKAANVTTSLSLGSAATAMSDQVHLGLH
eukprot:1500080-Amphidinium_carterae.1